MENIQQLGFSDVIKSTTKEKPYTDKELSVKVCKYSGRDLENFSPDRMVITTSEEYYIFAAGKPLMVIGKE